MYFLKKQIIQQRKSNFSNKYVIDVNYTNYYKGSEIIFRCRLFQTQEITNPPQGPTTARAPVTVTILDVNDQTPTFSKTFYNATVTENTQVKIPVTFTPDGTEMTVQDFDQVTIRPLAIIWNFRFFVTFSGTLRLICDSPVVTRRKNPPKPKSLAAFSHALAGIRTQAVVRDS